MLMGGRFGPPLIWPCVLDRTFCTNPVKPFINLCMLTICRKKNGLDRTNLKGSYFKNIFGKINIFRFFRSQNPWNSSERYWHYLFCNFTSFFIKTKEFWWIQNLDFCNTIGNHTWWRHNKTNKVKKVVKKS